MSYYDHSTFLHSKNQTGIRIKGWFWQDDFPEEDQPHVYEENYSTTSVEEAQEMLTEHAELQQKEKADPKLQDQPEIEEDGQMSLFT